MKEKGKWEEAIKFRQEDPRYGRYRRWQKTLGDILASCHSYDWANWDYAKVIFWLRTGL